MPSPIPDDERQRIVDLLPTGKSCNAIAREVGRSSNTISRIAASVGHVWGRANLAHAQEARSAYSAERRAEIAARMTEEAELLLDQLHGEYLVFNFGGKDNTYEEHVLSAPPVEAKQKLIQSTRDLLRTVIDISRHDVKADESGERSMLIELVDSLRSSPAA